MTRFEDNWVLLALLIIPVIIYYYFWGRKSGTIIFSSVHNIRKSGSGRTRLYRHILFILRLAAIVSLIIAMARPQSGVKNSEILSEGVDIVLAIDTSGSMQAMDFELNGKRENRLYVVKEVVKKFIQGRNNDRIGMVVFGANAFTQAPLTLDYGVLLSFLEKAEIGMAGDSTAIGSAIGTAVKRLKDLKTKSKVLILLTDGRNNSGTLSPKKAAEIAKTFNIKIYTIGAGTYGKAPFLVDTFFGKRFVYEEVDIDEKTLREVAEETGGKYFRATSTETLKEIYDRIDKMEKTEVKIKEYVEYNELFTLPLIVGILFLLGEIILANTRLRKLP